MALFRCGAGGKKTASGMVTLSSTGSTTIDLGFKAKYVYLFNANIALCYNGDFSTTQQLRGISNGIGLVAFPNTGGSLNCINSIGDTSVEIGTVSSSIASGGQVSYFACE